MRANLGSTLILLLAGVCEASCATVPISDNWCQRFEADFSRPEWTSLPSGSVALVRPEAMGEALRTLEGRPFVAISEDVAQQMTGVQRFVAAHQYLARTGVLGGPSVSLEEYLRHASSYIRFEGTWNQASRTFFIESFQLSGHDNPRNVAVVISAPAPVVRVVSSCHGGA